ncbi:uncharacterized protein LOC133206262 [Saccostrea echinata]|uniref:uncharacterized protein LOC133206262 n=1 Tax=Saccostrea echinata TaxID=191078 RepID=UPI002A824498|nr:uncharacterized protein LOC133206262 [Saccostrea echinata]
MSNDKSDSKKPLSLPTIYGRLDITLKHPHLRRKTGRIFDIVQDFRVRATKDRDTVSLPGREYLSLPEIDPHKKVSPSKLLTRQPTFVKPRSRQSWHSTRTLTTYQRSILDENEKDFTRRNTEKKTKKLLGELYTDKQYLEYIVNSSESSGLGKEIFEKSKKGLEYLKDRCMFWENQTPIPLRPDPMLVQQMFGSRMPSRRMSVTRQTRGPGSPLTQVKLDSMREKNRGKTFYK